MNTTISALIEKHLNATLTATEAAMLAEAMAENPALAEEFAAATRMESGLSAAMKESSRTTLYTRRMQRAAAETEPARMRRPWNVKTMAAAAGIAAVIGIGWRLMEVEPSNETTAKKGTPSPGLANTGGESHASFSGDTRIADASALKRKLRRFASSTNRLRGVPVSQALAALETEWKGYAHGDAKDKDAVFTVADAARKEWQNPDDEPAVSLEIPGISLLTSLELIAAQAGLKANITSAGVSLEPHTRKDDGKERTWNIPLSVASVTAFMSGASKQSQETMAWGRSLGGMQSPYDSRAFLMSWMTQPQAASTKYTFDPYSGKAFDVSTPAWGDINLAIAGQAGAVENGFIEFGGTQSRIIITDLNAQIQDAAGIALNTSDLDVSENLVSQVTWDVPLGQSEYLAAGGQAAGSTFDLMTEIAASAASDDNTIDLNLAPEVVEFDGFINYGEPIQTTGVNALGQSEPVILTDSGITQPVFATRVLMDHPGNLTRLLAAHGMPAEGATWDQENGVVTARGPLNQLRAAHAAAAAIEEAATAGVTVEMKVIEWKNGVPAPVADRSGLLPPPATSKAGAISAEAASDLLGDPDLERVGETKGTQHSGLPFTLKETKSWAVMAADGIAVVDNVEAGVIADVSGITGSGFSWHLPVNIRRQALVVTGPKTENRLTTPTIESPEHRADLQLQDGEWLRVDFPAKGDAKAVSVLLSVQSATVQP